MKFRLAFTVAAAVFPFLAQLPGNLSSHAAEPPQYGECRLDSLFPAGGQVGQQVTIDLFGNNGGLADARSLVLDGPSGIAVEKIENVSVSQVRATLCIAADAVPGRRMIRVRTDRCGLTNMLYFFVSRVPERQEMEPNNEIGAAERIDLPVIVNGRVNPAADVDLFRFTARADQRLTAAVFAHLLDSHGQGSNFGLANANLVVESADGRVVAEAQDTLGLDPIVSFTVPADGEYFARVQLVAYKGFPEAVYRLAIGELPVATSVFPPAATRGATGNVTWTGPLIYDGESQLAQYSSDPAFPISFVPLDSPLATGQDLPLLSVDEAVAQEQEPNESVAEAMSLAVDTAVCGRFSASSDNDWYRVSLAKDQKVILETIAHRYLRSPCDTRIRVCDDKGQTLAENDDGFDIDYISIHDYRSPDSRLLFQAPADGDYRVHVVDQSGNSGPQAAYVLRVTAARPDFELFQFPDSVPIWGPGSTAGLVVKVVRSPAGFTEDITLSIEGLPHGWTSEPVVVSGKPPQSNQFGKHAFLTITAPADAAIGSLASFRVVGRAQLADRTVERTAQTMTLYYTSDTGFFRSTPISRAVVAKPQGPWLTAVTQDVSAKVGGSVAVPVGVHGAGDDPSIALVANIGMVNVGCGLNAPATVPIENGNAVLTVNLSADLLPAGDYQFVVARSWRSDIRVGMPGPCTPPIRLRVTK